MRSVEVKFSDVKSLIQKAFPGAKSRRLVEIKQQSTYNVSDYWDGGSKTTCKFIELSTGNVLSSSDIPLSARQKEGNAYNLPVCNINLTRGYAVVEHIIFCGKDLGYRIVVAESNLLNPATLQSDMQECFGILTEVV